MGRLLLLGALAAAVLVQAATAAPTASHTLTGTVIGKDKAHRALVVARPGGTVQTLLAPQAFAKTKVGRRVVVRFTTKAGALPTAIAVTPKGIVHKATVHGIVVKLAKQKAVLNAGGSLLTVTLTPSASKRQLASAKSGPEVGDEVEVEIEIGDDGGLDADKLVGSDDDPAGELEVRGTVSALTAATATAAGSITVTSLGNPVTCAVAAGTTVTATVGDKIELKCELVGNPGVWTMRRAKAEDEHKAAAGGTGSSGGFAGTPVVGGKGSGGGDDEDEVDLRGTIAAPFTALSTSITVTPVAGAAVTCAITAGALSAFTAGDSVKIECKTVAGVLTLKEIEKTGSDDSGDDDDDHDHGDDD